MQKTITLKLLPSEAGNDLLIKKAIALAAGTKLNAITGYIITKQSIDARGRQPYIHLNINAFINEPFKEREFKKVEFKNTAKSNHIILIIGAGPAGLFAALRCLELGIKPIIVERGKDVKARRRDLATLNKEGVINPESNYCFGEGGAGTYSDGKLYTRSSKRGDVNRILNILVQFGADERILYEAHPHIGTNKLPGIITNIREHIINCGGEIHFEEKVVDFIIKNDYIIGVKTINGKLFKSEAVVLATGHSARDIYKLLYEKQILIEAKPFALGVRAEHPQQIIDSIQYHCTIRDSYLPPASYSLVQQIENKGVFSFCMCPGGIIAPAATNHNELVVNGWSPSKRNNPYANSGIVAEVKDEDLQYLKKNNDFEKTTGLSNIVFESPLRMMYFQQYVEKKAFDAGGGKFAAPAQRLVDFCDKKVSASLPDCSYIPGINAAKLNEVLPPFIYNSLQKAFIAFGKKMKGYYTNEAVIVATESRTSSPVRIPRNNATLEHIQIKNLYPCAEGAGYAGGIVSAAMDGENVAAAIALKKQLI